MPISVAYVFDPESDRTPRAVPDAVKERVAETLTKRNLEVQEIPLEKFAAKFASVRDSQQRLPGGGAAVGRFLGSCWWSSACCTTAR